MALSVKLKRKKVTVKTPRKFDEKFLGPEPTWSDVSESSDAQIATAYGWYNYFYDLKDSVKFLFKLYPRDKRELRRLSALPTTSFYPSLGWYCKMTSMGCKFPKKYTVYFNEKIDELLSRARQTEKQTRVETKKKGYVPTIQEKIREAVSNSIAHVENELDLFFANDYTSQFSAYEWFRSKNIKKNHSDAISSYYKNLLTELTELKKTKDQDLREGYSHLTKKQVQSYLEFVSKIVSDCDLWSTNQKSVKKIRKKKPVSVDKQISKLKYMREFPDLKLVSVSPAEIIEAQQLWVYNTKTRVVSVYNAIDRGGLKIKGTTVLNYDENSSFGKKLRKPDQLLPRLLGGGKIVLKNFMKEINSKESGVNGRMNELTVLLRVIK